jgi:hypothetical protein
VYRRRDGVLQPTEANDEACYIPLLDSLQQLLNDDFILAEVKHTLIVILGYKLYNFYIILFI